MTRRLATIGLALAVLLAGCLGGLTGTPTSSSAPATDDPSGDDAAIEPSNGATTSGESGQLAFYVSDEPNAIEDFEHLNVTITKIGVHQVEAGEDATDTPTATATATDTATETDTATATPNGSDSTTPTPTEAPTETADSSPTETSEDGEDDAAETDDGEDANADGDDDSDGQWVEYEVNETVDLTRLVGANSTKLGVLSAPAGEYDAVFIYVSDINATLENGESVDVKLPSNKLQIHKGFALEQGSEVSFVFDIAVHKAGKSGKYVLKPVISQSGTGDEVEIDDVDEAGGENGASAERGDGDEQGQGEPDEADESESDGADLGASLRGNVAPGNEVTLAVSGPDGPVANATVTVNGEVIGTTAGDGTISFTVPDAEELEITVEKGDAEIEIERDLSSNGNGGSQGGDNGQGANGSLAPIAG